MAADRAATWAGVSVFLYSEAQTIVWESLPVYVPLLLYPFSMMLLPFPLENSVLGLVSKTPLKYPFPPDMAIIPALAVAPPSSFVVPYPYDLTSDADREIAKKRFPLAREPNTE